MAKSKKKSQKTSSKKSQMSRSQHRSMRTQQIVMGIFGVLIILSMVLALVAK